MTTEAERLLREAQRIAIYYIAASNKEPTEQEHGVLMDISVYLAHSEPSAEKVIEALAELEHEQWMSWAKEVARSEPFLTEGRKARWLLAMIPYSSLTEEQKEHDRVWARKALDLTSPKTSEEEVRAACANITEEENCDQTEYHCMTLKRIAKAIRALDLTKISRIGKE